MHFSLTKFFRINYIEVRGFFLDFGNPHKKRKEIFNSRRKEKLQTSKKRKLKKLIKIYFTSVGRREENYILHCNEENRIQKLIQ